MPGLESSFDRLVRTAGAAPFITFVDLRSAERAELSARSLGNWVAKTHFLLTDALGLGPGEKFAVDTSPHWMGVPALLGGWFAGLELISDTAAADVAFVSPDAVGGADGVPDVFVLSLHPLGMPLPAGSLAGAEDYVTSVRPQPDAWASVRPRGGDTDPAMDGRNRVDALKDAEAAAAVAGLDAGDRVLAVVSPDDRRSWIDAVTAALAVDGSLVLAVSADPVADADRLDSLETAERSTVRLVL